MRIAMVAEPKDENNADVAEVAAALTAEGHDVTVHGRRGDPALSRAWARDRPDVVHTHSSATAATAALTTAARHGIPTVHSFHTFDQLADVEHILASSPGQMTVACTAHVATLTAAGVPRRRVSVVPGGVDVDLFTPEGPSTATRLSHRLIALGDAAPHAGFSTAIAALPALPNTELVVLGTPTDDLRRYADQLDVTRRVRFIRQLPREDLPALLRSADLAVCTPWREPSHGRPVLEAMACGITVVATTVGPLTDIVIDKVTGLLVPPRKPRTLADAIHRLLNHPVTREQYGATGRDRATARYAWQRIATETIHTYQRAGVAQADAPATPGTRRGRPIGASQ